MSFLLLNLGLGEIVLVMLCYLLFFGTQNFPDLMKDFGRFYYKIKRSVSDVYKEFNSDLKENDY